jgi:DNA-binding Lrp family transcriptional regulator
MTSLQIKKVLRDMGYDITDRAIRQRITRLEKNKVILSYSAILNPEFMSSKINRIVLLKFRVPPLFQSFHSLIQRLKSYVDEAEFCVYSARLNGDFDWILHFVFDSPEQYQVESDNFSQRFTELISDYRSYDAKDVKVSTYKVSPEHERYLRKRRIDQILNRARKYEDLNDKLQIILESLCKYFDAVFARIWLLDKEMKNLILKFSVGKYKNIHGEFSKVPVESHIEIAYVAKTKTPVISNDVTKDPRIKYPEWAKREKLKSFAAYPLLHNDIAIGVIAMFSHKKLNPADFELLGLFSNQISKELSSPLQVLGQLFAV